MDLIKKKIILDWFHIMDLDINKLHKLTLQKNIKADIFIFNYKILKIYKNIETILNVKKVNSTFEI